MIFLLTSVTFHPLAAFRTVDSPLQTITEPISNPFYFLLTPLHSFRTYACVCNEYLYIIFLLLAYVCILYVGHGLTNRGVLGDTVPGYRNDRCYYRYYRSKHGVKQVGWLLDFHVPSTVWGQIGTGGKRLFKKML